MITPYEFWEHKCIHVQAMPQPFHTVSMYVNTYINFNIYHRYHNTDNTCEYIVVYNYNSGAASVKYSLKLPQIYLVLHV